MELLGHKEHEQKQPQTTGKTNHSCTDALPSTDASFHAGTLPMLC
jgi:hypothetical protein